MRISILFCLIFLASLFLTGQTTNVFTVTNNTGSSVLTCSVTQIDLTVSTTVVPPIYFVWTGPVSVSGSTHVIVTVPGVYTVTMIDSLNHVIGNQLVPITSNTIAPALALNNPNSTVTCGSPMSTITANSSGNVTQTFIAPNGAVVVSTSSVSSYASSSPGLYTVVVLDQQTGCQTFSNFTISSNTVFPTFSLSSPQNFSLGCASHSLSVIDILNPQGNNGGAVGCTVIPAGSPSPSFPPAPVTQFSVTQPGLYYAAVVDLVNQCVSQTPFTILSNTLAPQLTINSSPNTMVLNCYTTQLTMQANANQANVNFVWTFPSASSPVNSQSLVVNTLTASPMNSVIAVYTLTGTDVGNACVSQITQMVYQNIYAPNAQINVATNSVISCSNPSITLVNVSTTGIPTNSMFANSQPVVSVHWLSNAQASGSASSTYVAYIADVYTLTVKDLNNGCTAQASAQITGTCNTVGIPDHEKQQLLTVYPNPANQRVFIQNVSGHQHLQVEFYNSLGQKLTSISVSTELQEIDLSDKPKGIYFVKIVHGNEVLDQMKLIKE